MCYVIITSGSLIWFVVSLIADMCILGAIVTPKWLIGPTQDASFIKSSNTTVYRIPSVGIYTRCKQMDRIGFHCGPFDLDGLATDNSIYPPEWKACMFFISLGFFILSGTVLLTLVTCCKQSAFGKSIHNLVGAAQVISGISVMIALFLHPLGWGAKRVMALCGPDAEAFFPAACSIGWAFYSAVAGVVLCFLCAGISMKAESSNMRSKVKRRVEDGERLVCVP